MDDIKGPDIWLSFNTIAENKKKKKRRKVFIEDFE